MTIHRGGQTRASRIASAINLIWGEHTDWHDLPPARRKPAPPPSLTLP